ncbi:MAG: hypothetical protein JKY52_09660 [Flavobacteriales bacterium]|nr:hypothetical protein [Flavobacteriales bacterium]
MITEREYSVFRPVKITLTTQEELDGFKLLLGESKHLALTGDAKSLIETLISDLSIYE